MDVIYWAKQVEQLGAGEIMLTSVDYEGIGEGFNIELLKKVANAVSIPVIAHGGAGKLEDISNAIKNGADAVALSSMLHYEYLSNIAVKDRYIPEKGNVDFLLSGLGYTKITKTKISEIKNHLVNNNIPCRNK